MAVNALLTTLRRSIRDTVAELGLADQAFWLYGKVSRLRPKTILSNARYRIGRPPGELPLPPPDLMFLVAGSTDISWFLEIGARGAASIIDALHGAGVQITEAESMLDFGCGCGRVLRHWHSLDGPTVYGTDYNPKLIEWCEQNLPFARYNVNELDPPLRYRNSQFDVVYALSVFTHLTELLQKRWIDELARILKPGGHLLITTHGESYVHRLTDVERLRFSAGDLVVKNNTRDPGSNTCSAYHPFAYVRDKLAAQFAIVGFVPEGAKGNPTQDLYVLRKPIISSRPLNDEVG